MNITDKVKLESWLTRYDFWLDSRGVPLGVRSALGREMRANLTEAAADVGLAQALTGVGEPRALATEAAEEAVDPTRPTWLTGLGWALTAALGYALVMLLSFLTFWQGAIAAAPAGPARGWALLVPGMDLTVTSGESFAFEAEGFPWLVLVVAGLGFLLGSRIWRLAIPAEQRRERVRLPRAMPEVGPRWLLGLGAAIAAFLVLSVDLTVGESEIQVVLDPVSRWWIALPAALLAYLLLAQPWRRGARTPERAY